MTLGQLIDEYALPSLFMAFTGLLDSGQTYLNIMTNNANLSLEGNPLIRNLVEATDLETGLLLPKVMATTLAIGAVSLQKETKKFGSKCILYGGGIYWAMGFLANNYYY